MVPAATGSISSTTKKNQTTSVSPGLMGILGPRDCKETSLLFSEKVVRAIGGEGGVLEGVLI